jgi:hypothetical protein
MSGHAFMCTRRCHPFECQAPSCACWRLPEPTPGGADSRRPGVGLAPRPQALPVPAQLPLWFYVLHSTACASVVCISVDPSVVGRDWSPVSSNKARGYCCRTPGDHRAPLQPSERGVQPRREEEEEKKNYPPAVARAVWSGRCWLRARCRCAALLVLVLSSALAMPN